MAENFFDLGKVGAIDRLMERGSIKKGTDGDTASVLLIEGTDFDLTYFPLKHLGYKAVVLATAELYSRMAHPEDLSVRLGVSSKLDYPQISELWEGMVSAAKEHGYNGADLDLKPSRNGLIISVCASGKIKTLTEKRRPKAHSKDLIVVSGPLGASYLGQQILEIENKKFRYIGMLYNAILGGTATSKLFQNVREKASLAYTANSSFSYYTGNIFVMAGIEIENYQKAVDIIKEQLDAMENGDFSEEDLSNAKKVIVSNIEGISDEQDTKIIYFLGQELTGNNVSLEEYMDFVQNVNREEIEDFAKKVKINTIYFLRN